MIAVINRNKTGFNMTYKRLLKHIAFWVLYYGFLLLYYWNINEISNPFRLDNHAQVFQLCFILVLDSIFLHYCAVQILLPAFKKNIALGVAGSLFLIFCTYWFNHFLLKNFLYNHTPKTVNAYYAEELLSTKNLYFFCNITIYLTFTSITLKLASSAYTASKKTLQLSKLRNDIEVEFLKSQIKPHFLFNALNSIYGIALNDEEAISILLDFSKLLRYLSYNNDEQSSLEEETDIIRIFSQISHQINPALHITLHYDSFENTSIKKYELFTQVQEIFADANAGEYTLTQENNTFHFKLVNA